MSDFLLYTAVFIISSVFLIYYHIEFKEFIKKDDDDFPY